MREYWFRPKRWGQWVAVYVPVTWHGWLITIILALMAVLTFILADATSHSVSDTLINYAPYAMLWCLMFDDFCFRFGEYPYWWGKPRRQRRNLAYLILFYLLGYYMLRTNHVEVWPKDNQRYVIINDVRLYYFYRPMQYLDAALTGQRFHLGPH